MNPKCEVPSVKNSSRYTKLVCLSLLALASCLLGSAQQADDPLLAGFQNPPDFAKPRVWWHWMNGNITKEGIKLDLEWMKRVGIGGFPNFYAAPETPKMVDKQLSFTTARKKKGF